jgi:hypothetical protein
MKKRRLEMRKELEALEEMVRERPEYVAECLEAWFKRVPKEEIDRPVMASFGQELEAITYTPREIYETLKKEIKAKKISKEKQRFLSEVVRMHKEGQK